MIAGGAQGIGRTVAERLLALLRCRSGTATSCCGRPSGVKDAGPCGCARGGCGPMPPACRARQETRGAGQDRYPGSECRHHGAEREAVGARWRHTAGDVVNPNGVLHCCRGAAYMTRRTTGASWSGGRRRSWQGGQSGRRRTARPRRGGHRPTGQAGKERRQNIAANCITPSAAQTRIFEQMTPEHIQYMLSKIPRGRFVEVDEIAAMVAWLVSAENSFTTGAVFDPERSAGRRVGDDGGCGGTVLSK